MKSIKIKPSRKEENILTQQLNSENKTTVSPFMSALDHKKVIVDTSSLLISGTGILQELPECELIIPTVVVSELEDKRTHPTLGFLARQWLRLIEHFRSTNPHSLHEGAISKKNNLVKIKIEPNHTKQESLPKHLRDNTNDKTILAVAKNFSDELKGKNGNSDNSVVLLSNDMPMRLHATLDLKIDATGYDLVTAHSIKPFSGSVRVSIDKEELDEIYSRSNGKEYAKILPDSVKSKIFQETFGSSFCVVKVVLDSSDQEAFSVISKKDTIVDIDYSSHASGISGKTLPQVVALNYLMEKASLLPVVSLGGSAGTGKTLLALAAGLEGVKKDLYEKVVVFRSLHEMGAGQEMGYLPGTADDKMQPWAGAIYDALSAISKQTKKQNTKKNSRESKHVYSTDSNSIDDYKDSLEISPITYLRGRSLSNVYIVIEEAQNFSFSELLNILSRVGQDSKVVMTFDAAQVDNKFLSTGNKADVWSVIEKLRPSGLFAHVTLTKTERSKVAEMASLALESGKLKIEEEDSQDF